MCDSLFREMEPPRWGSARFYGRERLASRSRWRPRCSMTRWAPWLIRSPISVQRVDEVAVW